MSVMLRTLVSLVISVLLMTALLQGAAYAAPLRPPEAQQICSPGQFRQHDMAGRYEMRDMLLEVYPCSGSTVWWINQYGEHQSTYFSAERLPGGGVVAYGYIPDPTIMAYLDNTRILAIKPAEVGWVQVATVDSDNQIVAMYRLRKTR